MKKALFIIGAYFILQTSIGLAAQLYVTATGIRQADSALPIPADILLVSLLASSILTAIAAILICNKGRRAPFKGMQVRTSSTTVLLFCVLTTIPLVAISNGLVEIIGIPDNMENDFSEMSAGVWALPVMAVIGPVSEEICFRYGVTDALLRQMPASPAKVIVISALIFGIIHMNPAQTASAFLLGLYFAWLYVRTHSIWPSVLCHVCNNFIAVVTMRTLPQGASLSTLLPAPEYIYLVLAVAVLVAIPLLFALGRKLAPTESNH